MFDGRVTDKRPDREAATARQLHSLQCDIEEVEHIITVCTEEIHHDANNPQESKQLSSSTHPKPPDRRLKKRGRIYIASPYVYKEKLETLQRAFVDYLVKLGAAFGSIREGKSEFRTEGWHKGEKEERDKVFRDIERALGLGGTGDWGPGQGRDGRCWEWCWRREPSRGGSRGGSRRSKDR